jgi:hypothetical protein
VATNPIPAIPLPDLSQPERPLTRDEWWDLFDHLRLSQQPEYAKYGGPLAFLREEREADSV